jgi:hypothetical protein
MKLFALLLCVALSLPLAARADDIPGGHVYLGAGFGCFALGCDVSAHLDVELARTLVGLSASVGGNPDVGRFSAALALGRVLTEGDAGLYVAGGAGVLSFGYAPTDGDAATGPFVLAEAGVRLPRSWQFGRGALALSLWVPTFHYRETWTPSLQLGVRLEL